MFFLVTGASGVGKTSVRKLIEKEIAGQVGICELATLGITPEWTLRWRHQAVEQVVRLALKHQESGKHFLLCGDPVPPGELYAAPSALELTGIQVCLLDASPERQTERLQPRRLSQVPDKRRRQTDEAREKQPVAQRLQQRDESLVIHVVEV